MKRTVENPLYGDNTSEAADNEEAYLKAARNNHSFFTAKLSAAPAPLMHRDKQTVSCQSPRPVLYEKPQKILSAAAIQAKPPAIADGHEEAYSIVAVKPGRRVGLG